ncbi:hypothetical protein, conserved [Babesia bigemina]|uniref:Ska2 N-terminal domain-containing protein n=1 Tax=Babesia bigemina TaxID=5866 RepID=A0A061DE69_BABBI|nr:hypothetical protein, conserved [Babesia bigemina]CDR96875.1 hypothetical protein, conserved [Babesia bigemina]|eukprot:XP_012769061.1 hypothetical protein, conserved [Babesia bigemina]
MASSRLRQPQAVEDALEFVRNKFADVGNDLDLVEKKLTAELGAVFGPDVFQLHGRCQDLKAQINKITRDLAELYEARKELVNVIGNQLTLSASLKNFERMIEPHAKVDDDTHSMEMLGMHYQAIWNGEEFEVQEVEEVETARPLTPLTAIGYRRSSSTTYRPWSKGAQSWNRSTNCTSTSLTRRLSAKVKLKEISQSGIQVFGQTGKPENARLPDTFRVFQIGITETVTLLDERFSGTHHKIRKLMRH